MASSESATVPRIVYLTAGAGGMYCGSCLNDNTLARALSRLGVDIQLVPTYTPIRTDEEDVSLDRVFFGGINVFLQQKLPFARWIPRLVDRVLNHPRLIRWVTRKDVQANAELLGAMAVSMLQGSMGKQRKEVLRLLDWLEFEAKPHLVCFTNVLIAGAIPDIQRRLGIPMVVTLQGDDIFLDYLPQRYREQAIAEIGRLTPAIDAFVVHSDYYRHYLHERLGIPLEKMHIVPLGIDIRDFERPEAATKRETAETESLGDSLEESTGDASRPKGGRQLTLGFLARLTPEKGFHRIVDAFVELRKRRADVRLAIAGWQGTEHAGYVEAQWQKLAGAGLSTEYVYEGTIDRRKKVEFLAGLDLFCVPTTYHEPKGLFALEAMAMGVPVVLPAHGAFPEMLQDVPGGVLFSPCEGTNGSGLSSDRPLVETLDDMLSDRKLRAQLSVAGREGVRQRRTSDVMARSCLQVYIKSGLQLELPMG